MLFVVVPMSKANGNYIKKKPVLKYNIKLDS